MIATLDPRDVVYSVVGLALLGLTFQPALGRFRWFNLPFYYVLAGVVFGLTGTNLVSPLASSLSASIIEHASELIVIISLAGAGLAIDTPASWRAWNPTWRLLAVTMPLTIGAVALFGHWGLGLSLPAALLLGAALAPTDPVLARSVQVAPPGQDEEHVALALTAEAGLNDGLAFPFVYLAIHAATLGVGQLVAGEAWLWSWIGFDLLYRVAMGIIVGWVVGRGISRIIFSPIGDGTQGAWNAVVVILSATLLSYGLAEALDGYGFLAVFVAMRASRAHTRGTEHEGYERFAHHGAEQLEAILLAILLLWLGTFIGSGAFAGLTWAEAGFALALVLVIRPIAGLVGLLGLDCSLRHRFDMSFYGIRGMGSIFYIAYAQGQAEFDDIGAVWRIATVTILASIIIHGYAANWFLTGRDEAGEEKQVHPLTDQEEDRPGDA